MPRFTCLLALLPVVLLPIALSACGSATPTASCSPAAGAQDGVWSGKAITFVVHCGRVQDVVLTDQQCADSKGTCTDTFGGSVAGTSGTAPISLALSGGKVSGKFTTSTAAVGNWSAKPGTCCTVSTTWTAAWQSAWTPPPDAGSTQDASITEDGSALDTGPLGGLGSDGQTVTGDLPTPGSKNWSGNSTGTAHPGPALTAKPPAAPKDASAVQVQALQVVDARRAAAGSPMLALDSLLDKAAQAHADFYGNYAGQYQAAGLSPHQEDKSFGAGYTGDQFWDRTAAAGFSGSPSAEVMAFLGDPTAAVDGWLETVYHRLPLLDPVTITIGYGMSQAGAKTDVIDAAARGPSANDPIVVWPWPGMAHVAPSWAGNEGPQPPPPPKGYPSGPVITAQFPQNPQVKAHQLLDAAGNDVAHVWLDAGTDPNHFIGDRAIAMYANTPLGSGDYTARLELTDGRIVQWRFHVGG